MLPDGATNTTKSSSSSRAGSITNHRTLGLRFAASDEAIARRASSDDRARRDVPVAMTDAFEFPDFFEYPPYFTCVPVPSRHASDLAPNTGRDDRTPRDVLGRLRASPTVPFLPRARSPHHPTRSPPRVPRAAFSPTRTPSVSRWSSGNRSSSGEWAPPTPNRPLEDQTPPGFIFIPERSTLAAT